MSSLACCKGDIDKGTPLGTVETVAGHKTYIAKPSNLTNDVKLVVIATDIFGYTLANPRLVADKFAAKGYLCLVPDLFKGSEADPGMMTAIDNLSSEKSGFGSKLAGFGSLLYNLPGFLIKNSVDGGCKIIEEVIAATKTSYTVKTVYVQGYCWGGSIVIKLAQKQGLADAVCSAHPAPPSLPNDIQKLVTPIYFALAEKDNGIKEKQWNEMKALLAKKEGFKYSLDVFEKVEHGFAVRGSETDEFVNVQRQKAFDAAVGFFESDIDKAIPQGRIETIAGHNVYVAKPASFNPNSSIKLVVIATDIFGYTLANPRLVADKYAAKGYLCLVPDLFKGTEASASMMAAADDMSSEKSGFGSKILGFGSVLWNMSGFLLRNNAAGGCKIVEDVITEARSKYSLTNVYLQGYCWGGTIGIKLAQKVGVVDAVVAAHPGPISFPTDIQNLVTPIFFALAEKDDFVKEKHWAEMRALLAKKEGFKYSLEIFEKTDHGFAVRGSETDEFVNMQRQKAFDAAVAFFESV